MHFLKIEPNPEVGSACLSSSKNKKLPSPLSPSQFLGGPLEQNGAICLKATLVGEFLSWPGARSATMFYWTHTLAAGGVGLLLGSFINNKINNNNSNNNNNNG